MDNFSMDLTAQKNESLRDALRIAFRHNAPGGKATHWVEMDVSPKAEFMNKKGLRKALVLLWNAEDRPGAASHKLPVPLDADGAYELVSRWLDTADYGHQPDHDGDNGKGFRLLYCDFWGHFEGMRCAIIGVVPAWAMYGK